MPMLPVILLISGRLGLAQPNPSTPPEAEIRRVVEMYMDAVRHGVLLQLTPLITANARRVNLGGIAQFGIIARLPSWRQRANLLRRVELLSPDTAIAIGVWKDFAAAPPFDTGTVQYTLIRQEGQWRIAYSYESFLPSPRKVPTASAPAGSRSSGRWEPLFDGKTFHGWRSTDLEAEPHVSWRIGGGSLVANPSGPRSSLMTAREFLFFDLRFEWQAVAKTNSGVKYRLFGFDRILDRSREAMGFEYQIAGDEGDSGARSDPRQRSGALYAVTPVERSAAKPLGEWNESRGSTCCCSKRAGCCIHRRISARTPGPGN